MQTSSRPSYLPKLRQLLDEWIVQAHPLARMREALKLEASNLHIQSQVVALNAYHRVHVFGVGKASATMAQGVHECLGERIHGGLVICPEPDRFSTGPIRQLKGNHPLPDEDSLAATSALLEALWGVEANDLVLFLISGGASAMLCQPEQGIRLDAKQQLFQALLRSGADIHAINVVRKHLSAVKGGKLLRHFKGAKVINLILSDVPGNDPSTIGSGPTVPDPSTLAQAHAIVRRYLPGTTLPDGLPETPKPEEFGDRSPQNHWISTPLQGAQIAASLLSTYAGIRQVWVDPQAYQGSLTSVLQHFAQTLERGVADPQVPQAFVFHGESEIQVNGQGMGGRNQHLALQFALEVLPKWSDRSIALLSFGTDGVDGNSPAAGALVDQETLAQLSRLGRDPRDYLERFDAYHFFAGTPYLIETGPTGNNLMDLQVVVLGKP